MVFDINGKVALVTGGPSGIGLHCTKELLRNGAKGVTMVDIDAATGAKAVEEIAKEFGKNKAIFVQTDVRIKKQLENAFQETVKNFKHIDILVNSAGILNDAIWEKQIDVNFNGTIHGILLAMDDFFPKYKQGDEAVVVNIASTCSVDLHPHIPIYCATKAAVVALTRAWGKVEIYEKTGVRFFALSPGVTLTPLNVAMNGRNLGPMYEEILNKDQTTWPTQTSEHVAEEFIKLLKYAPNGGMWIVDAGELAYEYLPVDRHLQKKNLLKMN